MAIELTIKEGDQAAEKKDFLTAISKYSEAINENPEAFSALIRRAQTYTRLKNYDSAKSDISRAFTVAEKRGKRSDKAMCYFRMGLVAYAEKDYQTSLVNLENAQKFECTEPSLELWLAKAQRDLKKIGGTQSTQSAVVAEAASKEVGEKEVPVQSVAAPENASSSIDTINKHAPLKMKIREEWYQSKDSVTITIFAKGVAKDSVRVEFENRSISVSFPTTAGSEYSYDLGSLYGEIVPAKSSFFVGSVKIEITLHKKSEGKWAALEGEGPSAKSSESPAFTGLAYPSSSRKKVDWTKFDVKEEEESNGDFFGNLYKKVDDDTKRAMMKSYVESNGTVLTTDWSEAKSKKFDTTPPEGMVAKKWSP